MLRACPRQTSKPLSAAPAYPPSCVALLCRGLEISERDEEFVRLRQRLLVAPIAAPPVVEETVLLALDPDQFAAVARFTHLPGEHLDSRVRHRRIRFAV